MGWFQFSRLENYPTHYADNHSPAHVDVLTSGFILAFVIVAISLFCLLPSYAGTRRWVFFGQVTLNLFIGGVVILGNYGQTWEVGSVSITSPYKAANPGEIKADLGLYIGLRGINITLKGTPETHGHSHNIISKHEQIDYNEHFSWAWTQGRFGFGYYAARIAREFREAVYRGVPTPILQLAEYFTFDEEGIRFGRHYRLAGWYAHIMMWTAFPCWLISAILFCVVVHYGAMFMIATGIFQLIAVSIWYSVRNSIELQVPYEYKDHEVILKTKFGADFYLVLINAILCIGLGFWIFFLNALYPDDMCKFFGIDPLTLYDEYHLTTEEIEKEKKPRTLAPAKRMTAEDLEEGSRDSAMTDDERSTQDSHYVLRRRTDAASRLFKKSFKLPKRKPTPPHARTKPTAISEERELDVRTPLLKKERVSELSIANYPPPSPVDRLNPN